MLPAKTPEKVQRWSTYESRSTGKGQRESVSETWEAEDVVTGRTSHAQMQTARHFCRYPFLDVGDTVVSMDCQIDRIQSGERDKPLAFSDWGFKIHLKGATELASSTQRRNRAEGQHPSLSASQIQTQCGPLLTILPSTPWCHVMIHPQTLS